MTTKIYERLKKNWDKYQYKSYRYQNLDLAGLMECEEIYLNEPINAQVKNDRAKGLLELLLSIMEEDLEFVEIKYYVDKFPIIQYYFVFIDKIKILLNEGVITKEQLDKIGTNYITEFEESEIIKVGLTLLRFASNDRALENLKIFSNHNEYIFYAIEGIKEYKRCINNIFNIAKASKGYGRILSITNLEPINDEIKLWLIEQGSGDGFLNPVIVAMIYNEVDYFSYFEDGEITKKKFQSFTKNLLALCEIKDFLYENVSFKLVSLYWDYYKKYGGNFKSRYVMGILISVMIDNLEEDAASINKNLFINEEEDLFTEIVEKYMIENHEIVIKKVIANNQANIQQILQLAKLIEVTLEFDDLEFILKQDPYCIEIYEYIMDSQLDKSKEGLIEYCIENAIFNMVMTGDENIDEEAINDEYLIDSCLFLLISKMGELTNKYLEFTVEALKARYAPTRLEATKNIALIETEELTTFIKQFEECISKECDENIKRELLKLINKNSFESIKIKDIEELMVTPHIKDICLIDIELYLNENINMKDIIKTGENNTLVLLKRDKLNINSDKAIMILSEQGDIMAFIPNEQSEILSNLIDNGKVLYGNIKSKDEVSRTVNISIFLSYADVINEVTNTLSMVTDMNFGYVN